MLFQRVTIVGLGLIGGSLGMAIRRKRLAGTVVGLSRAASTIRQAKRRGAIDVGTTDARCAVAQADLVVLATPVDTIVPHALRLAQWMRPGSILIDVGSTKAQIVKALERRLPESVTFVGGHPLAGSEQRGITAARAGLFEGSLCVLTRTRRTDPRALRLVGRLWSRICQRVVTMDPREHDRLLAAVSHVPHLIAFSLVRATDPAAITLAPRSFLDATRVAQSDPQLWDDILLSNRTALRTAAGRFERAWRTLRRLLIRRDRAALRRFLAQAKAKRDALK